MSQAIGISIVLSEINRPNSVFSLSYRKIDGEWGEKKRVAARKAINSLNERKKMNRSGLVKLWNLESKREFDLVIDLLETFNGVKINFYA